MSELTAEMIKALCAPLPKDHIQVKPGAVNRDKTQGLVLTYMDARAVQDRLDDVCPGAWEFNWEPVAQFGPKLAVKGYLTVCGLTRSDVGQAVPDRSAEDEPYKSAVSDALKRCAIHFGIGRYLYDLPQLWWPGKPGYGDKGFYFDDQDRLITHMGTVIDAVTSGKAIPKSPVAETHRTSGAQQSTEYKSDAGTAKVNAQHIETLKKIWSDKFGGEVDAWKTFLKETIGHSGRFEDLTTSEFTMLCSAANKIKKAA